MTATESLLPKIINDFCNKIGIEVTIPLYTKLQDTLVPKPPDGAPDQLIDWWNGAIIQVYASFVPDVPRTLVEAIKQNYPDMKQVQVTGIPGSAVLPTCVQVPSKASPPAPPVACKPLTLYSAEADLPKADFQQLLEFTLGALNEVKVNNPATDPPNTLDVRNVDFDVSYVNPAYMPAVMGPFDNDQVGYVGSELQFGPFRDKLNQFLTDTQVNGGKWPQFVHTYKDGATQVMLKIPSPLEIFGRITPGAGKQVDLTDPPNWPTQLWAPIEQLRTNWKLYAGEVQAATGTPYYQFTTQGQCTPSGTNNSFCDAILQVRDLLLANYTNYRNLFSTHCTPGPGLPVDITNDRLIAQVYGWTPWINGCKADDQALLLQNTPGAMPTTTRRSTGTPSSCSIG